MPTNHFIQTAHQGSNTILAIDPSTRDLGVAVFGDGKLMYYTIKAIKPRRPRGALLETIATVMDQLIRESEPAILAIEHISLNQKSEALLTVVAEDIKTIAASQGLEVKEYQARLVREQICRLRGATKRQTALVLCQRYPELAQYGQKQTKSQARYYGHLFDAVAVGWVCASEISGVEPKGTQLEEQLIF